MHERPWQRGAKSTLPAQRAEHVAAVSGKRAKRRPALEYCTELTHRRPKHWIRDVDRLHELLATSGDDAVRAAFTQGLTEQAIGAEDIAHALAETVAAPRPRPLGPPAIGTPPAPRGGPGRG